MKLNFFICLLSFLIIRGNLTAQQFPYKDKRFSTEQRVQDLLKRMTLEEKVDQLNMKSLKRLKMDEKGEVTDLSLESLFKGHSIGCLQSPNIEHDKIAAFSEAADRYLRTQTRLGIPAIQVAECLHGHMALGTTIFPQAIAMGSTWNPELIQSMASVIAEEASLAGVDQALSPLFDLARDPRYGRVEECYGEDPCLVKKMGVAFVTGMQGDPNRTQIGLDPGKIACTAKHFVAYSIPQAGLNLAPAVIGERGLRELHMVPFEAAVKEANIYSLMPGYQEVDGIPVHSNHWLLTDVLRKEWGFNGFVISDYGALRMLSGFHAVASDRSEVASLALSAGVDLEAPGKYAYGELEKLIKEKKISESLLDTAVARILRVKFKMGLFDRPFTVKKDLKQRIHKEESKALAQKIAEESIILLKNDKNILPLNKRNIHTIGVIGPNADRVQFGDYCITKNKNYGTTVLEGLRHYLGKDVRIKYTEGCGITNLSKDGFTEAEKLTKESDVVILVLGGTSSIISGIGWGDANSKEVNTCGEGFDRNELNFPGVQSDLLKVVAKQGKPVVLVMINGRPYTIPEEVAKVDAVVEAWYPGEKGGDAVARILLGEVNPSGRLSMSFPRSTGHIPVCANYKPSGRGYYHIPGTKEKPGRDYVFSSPTPLFSFGYGLSYTSFDYSDLKIGDVDKDKIDIQCSLENTGKRSGAEVVQLYIRDKVSSVTTPVRALKDFKKIYLKPGERKTVLLSVKKEDLKLWNADMKKVLEPGEFEVYVGASADDIRLKGRFVIQ